VIVAIDHVQLAMPPGGEDAARRFYAGVLGLREVPKPAALAARGGAWFEAGPVRVHLGVEQEFRPAVKAHPGFLVDDLGALIRMAQEACHRVVRDDAEVGVERAYVFDPFGNRLELIQA
jgi:catechol 2,3-dioxygenase-like lactoylglutathione lyase family enzyme